MHLYLGISQSTLLESRNRLFIPLKFHSILVKENVKFVWTKEKETEEQR